MATIFDVADFFLANADREDHVTHLKLQKLCAYAQAFSLALRKKPLFSEPLEAWSHGPVVSRLYDVYKASGRNTINTDVTIEDTRALFDYEELYILETVNSYYGGYAPHRLRDMSHIDFPGVFGSKDTIQNDDIAVSFKNHKVIRAILEGFK